jgi:poly(A) polymerase
LRAVRFTVKLDFEMDEATARPIPEMAPLLRDIPPARLFEEVLKLFLGGFAAKSFQPLRDYRLLDWLLPQLEHSLNGKRGEQTLRLVQRVLDNTDARLRDGKPVTPAFLFAAFLWEPMVEASERFMSDGVPQLEALQLASDEVISKQVAAVAVPRRLTKITREIWTLQPRFARTTEKRAARLFAHPRFRAAYDFLVLRRESGEDLGELCDWWEHYQEGRPPVVHAEKPRRSRRRPPD